MEHDRLPATLAVHLRRGYLHRSVHEIRMIQQQIEAHFRHSNGSAAEAEAQEMRESWEKMAGTG